MWILLLSSLLWVRARIQRIYHRKRSGLLPLRQGTTSGSSGQLIHPYFTYPSPERLTPFPLQAPYALFTSRLLSHQVIIMQLPLHGSSSACSTHESPTDRPPAAASRFSLPCSIPSMDAPVFPVPKRVGGNSGSALLNMSCLLAGSSTSLQTTSTQGCQSGG